jgi:hypothetical protein
MAKKHLPSFPSIQLLTYTVKILISLLLNQALIPKLVSQIGRLSVLLCYLNQLSG